MIIMKAKILPITVVALIMASATHAQQCRGRVVDEYRASDADVIIGVMQSFYGTSNGMTCSTMMKNKEIYDAVEVALVALPPGMQAPNIHIGLERYESCGIPERAVDDSMYYTALRVEQVNKTNHGIYPCLETPFRPGMIGPYTSTEAVAVSPILSNVGVPTISATATSPVLSDKKEHEFFLRTVPSDSVQAQAMVEFLHSFSWSYVHLVYSEGSYGENGAEAYKSAAKGHGTIASSIKIPSTGADYDLIVSQLISNQDAKVVVFWGSSSDLFSLMSAIQSRGGAALDLQIVGCDYNIPSDMISAKGFFSVAPGEFYNADVQNYLMMNNITIMDDKPASYVPSAIDATHVYVDALRRAHSDKCGASTTGVCDAMKSMSSAEFTEMYLKTPDFTGVSGRRIAFNENGDPVVPAFEIRQLQLEGATLTVKKIGQWMGMGTLMVNENEIEFKSQNGMTTIPPMSSCSSDSCPVVYDHYDVLNLAGIFPVHESDCATLSHHPGIDQAEAMLWAMDQVNKDSSLLPGMQLKPMLGESCSSPDQAASVTYDFVRHFTRMPNQAFGRYHNEEKMQYEYMAGVISRVEDEETVEIDEVLQPLGVPHVSDSARLPALSDKTEYPYFSRMVAPSCAMVTAILEFLKERDLTYVQVMQSRDGIFNTTAANFIEQAKENGICVAQTITFDPVTDYNGVVDHLLAKPSADIVIIFANNYETQFLFSALERRNLPGEFLQMIYAFTADTNYLESWNREVHTDSITLRRRSTPVEDFVDHFISLTPQSQMEEGFFPDMEHNTWFAEYWMNKFRCQLGGTNMPQLFSTPCSGTESLSRRDVYTAEGVINSVYVYAHALTNLHRNKCPGPHSDGLCDAMLQTSPLEWARYIREVRFMSRSGSMADVSFDGSGDAPPSLNILALDHYLSNQVLGTFGPDGLANLNNRWAVGNGKESTCRGACYDCSDSEELGGTYLRIPGDFDITAVLWLSEEGDSANLTCGATRHQETMAIEIIKHALEEINNSTLIFPDIKLGLTIVDSCGQFLVTARQLTALIGRTVSNLPETGPMLGVLGPVREYLQGHVASDVTSPFYIPTIGFTPASPSVFSDEGPYPASSLFSTAPAYDNEAIAVVDILKYKGWQHVVFVYSHSYYGHAGNESFNSAARAQGICVRDSIGIDLDSPRTVHEDVVQMIRDYRITVVVAFVESTDARNLLKAEMESSQGPEDKITWIGSDKWFTDPDVDVTAGLESVARGAIVVTNYMVDFSPLKEHLSNLDMVQETKDNHWLHNYVTDEFTNGCTTPECLQSVDLGEQGVIPPYAATLVNAVHALAQAAHNKMQILCGNEAYVGHVYKRSDYHRRPNGTVPLCPEFFEASWHDLLYAVKDVYVFEGAGRRPFWFENRQGPAEYTIINFQGQGSSGKFVPVGEWVSGELTMEDDMTYLYNEAADQPIDAPSECPTDRYSCPSASAPETQGSAWTWSTGMTSWSIVVLIVTAIVGFLCVAAILVFIGRRNSPVIKNSNPFLMSMLSVGIILMYLNNIWYMVSPVETSCGVQRWMTSFSYAVVYAVLLTKTICASFLARGDSASKSIFNSFPMMHVMLFCVLLGAEVILVTEWLILDAPGLDASYEVNRAGCEVFIGHTCSHDNVSIVVSMIYVYILVLATLVMSFFSSNGLRGAAKKENKFHLLTSLLSICFLVAWACCYTLLPQENYQTPAILIGITVDATAIFLCNIVPKMLAFFNSDEDDASETSSSDFTETYKEKSGFDNKGAAVNETDDQTPL